MEKQVHDVSSEKKSTAFVPPRHWVGLDELDANYWSDAGTRERRGREFSENPIEAIDAIDRSDQKGLARRDFLTLMGASMAMASFACARRPVHKIIPYVVKPDEITPGVATWYASTSAECFCGCGILIKTREGRPIKLEGNPDHPVNRGALCARGQASLLNLYDPDRLKVPTARIRGSGGAGREVSWSEADGAIQAKLREAAAGAGRVRVLSGAISGDSTRQLINDFLLSFRAGEHVEFEPLALEEIPEAQTQTYGTPVIPRYRFDRANLVLSLGADFLGTWLSPVEHAADWAKRRKLDSKDAAHASMSKLICFEPILTLTGANADERYPIRPGDELKIALSIAHQLIVVGKRGGSLAADATLISILNSYRPELVAAEVGLENGVEKIRSVAAALWESRGRSLVIAGGIPSKTKDSLNLQIAVNLLNTVLENEGITVDGTAQVSFPRGGFSAVSKLTLDMMNGLVDVLIVYRSNPAFTLPKTGVGFEDAVKRVPLVIAVGDREDETALLANYVLPDHHYLENWGDANPRRGIYSLQQPAIAPIHSTRAFQDSLLTWMKGAGLRGGAWAVKSQDWHDYLRVSWRETVHRKFNVGSSFGVFWEGALRAGVFDGHSSLGLSAPKPTSRPFRAAALGQLPRFAAQNRSGVSLALYSSIAMYDGRSANNAWLQELPDPITTVTWDNCLNVAPATARKLGLNQDDVVEISAGSAKAELPVYVQPGMHPSVVSVAVGYGRRAAGKVGTLAGVDVFPFLRVEGGRLIFSGQSVSIRKTGRFYRLAATQWHSVSENRPIINDITLSQFKKNPAAANHTDPHLRMTEVPTMWPVYEYKGHRWGMSIDLSSCIGCGACVIGCQAENNIPVVGRDQVRVGRQMHWIRIDRYYSSSPENPSVLFQPMLCQHCENAPCETVCPVLATVHDDEGLNVQVYNRCVGTRYCQNNCPYKVRRFNFFDHWKSYEGTMNLVWNPDITVRTRGIMEKCTFCVQRVREAKDQAKDRGEKVADGSVKTACQQTCPTDAIVFGDMNDPNARISKLQRDARAFRSLETLNTRPSVSYLSKVRNVEGLSGGSHGGSHS